MVYSPAAVGGGYNDSLLRLEFRPRTAPHTREELVEILDVLERCGVDAWWYSVSAKGSYPLFPSRVLPYRKDAATDVYPWLVEEGHRRGIVMVSWEYLNTAPLLMAEHPDWRVRYLRGAERFQTRERHDHFACFRSPYGEMLKEYCVEVLRDLGFDCIWFDGCYLHGPADDGYRWSCCCERCAKAFRDETGHRIPEQVSWGDPAFHRFVEWRYRFFEDYGASLAAYVRARCPTKLVAFNFFNRHYMGAASGDPLRHREIDQLIAAEGTTLTVQMQIKVLRALSGRYPPEVWTHLLDGAKLGYPSRPDPEPAGNIFYAQAAATAGGFASFGIAHHPRECAETLEAISAALRPLRSYVGGEPARCCGLVFSGSTKDFAHDPEPGDRSYASKHKPAVDAAYGMGFLLNALHYPFEIVLENRFDETLAQYAVVVLPDVQCMDEAAARGVSDFVARGGVLVATGETGTKTPSGERRARGVLDELLGITSREAVPSYCVLEPATSLLRGASRDDGDERRPPEETRAGARGSPRVGHIPLPARYMVSGKARLVSTADDAHVLAVGVPLDHVPGAGTSEQSRPGGAHDVAVCERRVGSGRAVFVAPAIGSGYSQNPNRRSREVIRRLIGAVPLPFTTDAPPNVVVTAWRQPGRLVLHLLNQPDSMCRMLGHYRQLHVEDVAPTGPIRIVLRRKSSRVWSPTHPSGVRLAEAQGGTVIVLERLETHAVIAVEAGEPSPKLA